MFEVRTTGTIVEIAGKQYIALGLFDRSMRQFKDEQECNLPRIIQNMKNLFIPPIECSSSDSIESVDIEIPIYYYSLYYYSNTLKEFILKILAQDYRLVVCDYSLYPSNIKPITLIEVLRASDFSKVSIVGNIKEEDVKCNLLKRALCDPIFSKLYTTTEAYNYFFTYDYKITSAQKNYLREYLTGLLQMLADNYYNAKKKYSHCLAKVLLNGKYYLGYVCFDRDNKVLVYAYCSMDDNLKTKIELIFSHEFSKRIWIDSKNVEKIDML